MLYISYSPLPKPYSLLPIPLLFPLFSLKGFFLRVSYPYPLLTISLAFDRSLSSIIYPLLPNPCPLSKTYLCATPIPYPIFPYSHQTFPIPYSLPFPPFPHPTFYLPNPSKLRPYISLSFTSLTSIQWF